MRAAFSDALVALAQRDPKVLLLTGDHGYALFDPFIKACPDQYMNCGIAEQNMVGVAAGLAKAGFRPFVYGLSAFVPIRVLEQIKIDICYENLPVTLVGDGAGVVYAQLGTSHQSTEDIAALRAVPGINIYSPADRFELTSCMNRAYDEGLPAYLRMGKADLGDVHSGLADAGSADDLVSVGGNKARYLFLGTGSGVKLAERVAQITGGADVVSCPRLKPFPEASLHELAKGREGIVTFEEHAIDGGLGSIVAERLLGSYNGKFLRIGIQDRFSTQCGDYRFLMESHGLAPEAVAGRIAKAFNAGA
ncbi:transketolase family protein [Paraburkholderia phenazinium]|uniref:Transketolase subunit B n=1 Tax=Paraburkholderia phenazinium TaxID=60549 RepID=A0A1N6LGI6_9BURK|nr:transketolase C-terminal domain-containing protein [Paraburkholderia phenazinium]SIO67930.1 transketolase subunit B [Paraburkholderia phenazinium]